MSKQEQESKQEAVKGNEQNMLLSDMGLRAQDYEIIGMIEGILEVTMNYHFDIFALHNKLPEQYKYRVTQLFRLLSPKAIAAMVRCGGSEWELLDFLLRNCD